MSDKSETRSLTPEEREELKATRERREDPEKRAAFIDNLGDQYYSQRLAEGSLPPSNLESSVYDCVLISQKIEEWRGILESAQNNPKFITKELAKIQNKIAQMTEIIFKVHGRADYSDDLISKIYYHGYLGLIYEIRESYAAWEHKRTRIKANLFLRDRP